MFLDNHQKPMSEQKEIFEQTLIDWVKKGEKSIKQIDDILVIGFKVGG